MTLKSLKTALPRVDGLRSVKWLHHVRFEMGDTVVVQIRVARPVAPELSLAVEVDTRLSQILALLWLANGTAVVALVRTVVPPFPLLLVAARVVADARLFVVIVVVLVAVRVLFLLVLLLRQFVVERSHGRIARIGTIVPPFPLVLLVGRVVPVVVTVVVVDADNQGKQKEAKSNAIENLEDRGRMLIKNPVLYILLLLTIVFLALDLFSKRNNSIGSDLVIRCGRQKKKQIIETQNTKIMNK